MTYCVDSCTTLYTVGKMEFGELDFTKEVGEGAFGVVFQGFWNTKKAGKIVVAIKNLLDKEDDKEVSFHRLCILTP